MRKSALVTMVLALAAVLAGCAGEASPPPAPPVVQAVVDTAASGCDAEAIPGDCWLPLYPQPEHAGEPLNLREAPGSPCTRTDQAQCWPQPGMVVRLECQISDLQGNTWYGVAVPRRQQLTPSPLAEPARHESDAVIGYNMEGFLQTTAGINPPAAPAYELLPPC